MTLGGPDLARCTRRTRTGELCAGPAIRADSLPWVNALDSCGHHLTADEKKRRGTEHEAARARRAAPAAPRPAKTATERRHKPIDHEGREAKIAELRATRSKSRAGRPPMDPQGLTGGLAQVAWIYGPGQLDLLRTWAAEDNVKLSAAIRHAVAIGLGRPFPKALVEHEANLVTGRGRRAGEPGEGRSSPHYKWTPGPGQLEKLDARASQLGLSRNAVTRVAVRVAERRRATP